MAANVTQILDPAAAAWSTPQNLMLWEDRMAVTIVLEEEPYRLITDVITDGDGHYAVIEARNGLVYSLHSHDRHEASDTAEGMAAVVGDGWCKPGAAMECYCYMTQREACYSKLIW
jgi:hypothetical protein